MNTSSLPLGRPVALGLLLLALAGSGCAVFHRHRHELPPAAAAPPPPAPLPPTAARDLADVMTDLLKLRPDQTGKVRQILNETVTEVNAARQQHPTPSPELTTILTRINTTSEGKLRQVLGTAKYQELQAKRPQIQAEMQKR